MASILSHNAYDASIGVAHALIFPKYHPCSGFGHEYWITQATGVQVTPDGVQYVEGINSKEGNAGSDSSILSHNAYDASIGVAHALIFPKYHPCSGFGHLKSLHS
jgi:hypothetical protein